jgi:hypothetical protein
MMKDALLGGALLSVVAVLRDPDMSSILSNKGFAAAPWVALVCIFGFLVRVSLARPETEGQDRGDSDRLG